MLTLDVGCGERWTGDVNCDFDLANRFKHRRKMQGLTSQDIPNFVVCDSQHLPFKSECFDKVISQHTIEHVPDPDLMFHELLRVSKKHVLIRCPHRLGDCFEPHPNHIQKFAQGWFNLKAKTYRLSIDIRISRYKFLPHEYFPLLQVPVEMTIDLHKNTTPCSMHVNNLAKEQRQ